MLNEFYFVFVAIASAIVAISAFVFGSALIYVGVASGLVLGIVPFASWHFVIKFTDFFRKKRTIKYVVFFFLLKFILLVATLCLLFGLRLVNPLAFLGGFVISIFTILVLSLIGIRVKL
jgi:hypothetical protein